MMKEFWNNYKSNLKLLVDFSKKHWKPLIFIYMASGFVVYALNFLLSVYIIDTKYFLGDDHFLPDIAVVIIIVFLTEFIFLRYIKRKKEKNS